MEYLIASAAGYLFGSFNTAYFIAKRRGTDIRTLGTGNAGASNALISLGAAAGITSAVVDILKSFAVICLIRALFGGGILLDCTAGAAAVCGHIFPFYLRFRGGKGVAAYFGICLAVEPLLFVILAAVVALIVITTDYIVFGSLLTVVVLPVYLAVAYDAKTLFIMLPLSALMIFRHRENLLRLKRGEEIGWRKKSH